MGLRSYFRRRHHPISPNPPPTSTKLHGLETAIPVQPSTQMPRLLAYAYSTKRRGTTRVVNPIVKPIALAIVPSANLQPVPQRHPSRHTACQTLRAREMHHFAN